ncbi:hypothetical protein FHQ26_00540 [Testudinibacter sp. TR-2022]|uniref:hypothetical protein n=1 Tax=Testudinibacter sp. TR-2022 TaxID=2585029 RepID=UPI0011198A2C|nr:hypothetical protein [Testudinibacter sp. TR-2022]TNH04051.1 hypothetical protein FHQ22_05900 [Pasteurellaceae bacterium Phil31]TNH10164.1 hypothetical protein FHQ25_06075 [Testudinibacter sp. TR-2022]TNH13024.1 hypothetical protein FHQ26_00540 [Testudinibacter sp. TR-2022]
MNVIFEFIKKIWNFLADNLETYDDEDYSPSSTKINPATGLPMSEEVDINGNPYGCSNSISDYDPLINPATGLPMSGGIDIAGNPYGSGSSSSSCSDSTIDYHDNNSSHSFSSGYEYTSYSSSSSDDY